jgi:hypothetical protein
MENNQLQTTSGGQTPAFVQEKLNSLAGALEYANVLLKSGIAPAHFYHKGSDGKPDYTKGKPEAVVIVLQFGSEIGMSPMQALQQLVPVNNLVSLKGDGAKALIQRSGKLATWEEVEIGTQGKDDWGFRINASRKDTGEKNTASFTVADAKRAGLWIDDAALQRSQGLRHSPWYKHPRRMLKYRALGFLSRDLFPDVLSGIYTEEEAADFGVDNNVFVADGGIQVDMTKADKTEANNNAIAAKIEEKEGKVKKLAGKSEPKVELKPEVAPEPVKVAEAIQEPEVISTTTNTAGAIDINRYEESLRAMSPQDLGKEFRTKHTKGILPFSVEQWIANGGSKLPKDLIMVLVASHKSSEDLNLCLKNLGLDVLINFKAPRGLDEQLEIMDAIEAAGADADLLAGELGFSGKEDMLANGDKELILSKVQ